MQKNYSAKSKILKRTVLGIAIYLISLFAATLLLNPIMEKMPYNSILTSTFALFIAALVSFFTLGSEDRTEIIYDKNAAFAHKPYYIIYAILLSFAFTVSFNFLFSLIPWDAVSGNNIKQNNDYFFSFPLYIQLLTYAVMIPFSEEMLFRVLIFFRLKKVIAYPAAALLTGIAFGIYHGNLMQGIYAFFMGTIICLVMHYGGSFFYAVLFHSVANLISTLCSAYPSVNKSIYSLPVIILSFIYIVVAIILGLTLKNKLTKKDK